MPQVCVHLGLVHSLQHFSGIVFQFVDSSSAQSGTRRRVRRVPLAVGGRYDRLLGVFRRPGKQSMHPGVSVVGVNVLEEAVMGRMMSAYVRGSVSWSRCGAKEDIQKGNRDRKRKDMERGGRGVEKKQE